jgi:hypothetical protein
VSVESLAIALNHSRARGTVKLVMLGIANHDGDGGAWPSVQTLARYANVTPRNVQKAIEQLERLGEIRRLVQRGGTHLTADSHRPNLYQVLLQCPPDCDRSSQHRTRRQMGVTRPIEGLAEYGIEGVSDATPPVGFVTPGVSDATPAPLSESTPKPSTQPTTTVPKTKPSDRARAFAPVWPSEKCPGNWKTGAHEKAAHGRCQWCHEAPTAHVDTTTGEVR